MRTRSSLYLLTGLASVTAALLVAAPILALPQGQTIPAQPIYLPVVMNPPTPTFTPTPTPSPTPVPTPIPTATRAANGICSRNMCNCPDFTSQAEAQAVFAYCMAAVGRDVHWLDHDDDGIACELPNFSPQTAPQCVLPTVRRIW